MTTKIYVTGQINGNSRLASAIGGRRERTMFNGFVLTFDSRKEAREAIRKAYHSIKIESDYPLSWNTIRKSKDNGLIHYDASKAEISND
jgi:hypothetical protein